MAGDDELERLLREVDATLSGTPAKPAAAAGKEVAGQRDAVPAGRVRRGLRTGLVAGAISGVVVGAGTFLIAWLPGTQSVTSAAVGAFLGAFGTGAVLAATRKG
ncbi:MAG: hypothetical protein LCI03_09645 [Actinobacteria bacterium]|jgi:hypothetical protein|nr:hypothetical protein [Actinomycetota bacterium]